MAQAFIALTADRTEVGPLRQVAGALQQETRLYQGDQCVCKLLITFPPGSPEWERWSSGRTLDGMPPAPNATQRQPEVASV